MQVFHPFPSISASLDCLDKRRLGKQRVEAKQIIEIVEYNGKGWSKHPCVVMYRPYLNYLKMYYNTSLEKFELRGGQNNVCQFMDYDEVIVPPWIGNESFHNSHLANLMRKAIDDSNGISRLGRKKPSNELLERLAKFGYTPENVDIETPYMWPVG